MNGPWKVTGRIWGSVSQSYGYLLRHNERTYIAQLNLAPSPEYPFEWKVTTQGETADFAESAEANAALLKHRSKP